MLIAIWAQDQQGLIGKNERLPWHLPNDLKFFKEMTVGHTMVMGRKTFEGMGKRPLPNRQTIVLTRDKSYQNDGILVMHSLEEVLTYVKQQDAPVYVTGGSMIYQDFLPYCDKLYRTVIEESFEGDTYFPPVDWQEWKLYESVIGQVDEKNHYPHRFEKYRRK